MVDICYSDEEEVCLVGLEVMCRLPESCEIESREEGLKKEEEEGI